MFRKLNDGKVLIPGKDEPIVEFSRRCVTDSRNITSLQGGLLWLQMGSSPI